MANETIQNVIEAQRVDKSASAVSIQHPPPYLTRQPLYITNPTLFSAQQWREVAREPVAKLCIRHILREITALEWDITHEDPEANESQIKYLSGVFEDADDGDGWDAWLSRMVQDALILPIGGNSELAPDDLTGMLGGLYHIDGATLYPTYDPEIPFVQINPYNGLDRVYFLKGDIGRIIVQPRTELAKKMYQEAPVESAFTGIESLSRMYIYYLKQLSDTPLAGILDAMDMTEDEVTQWAVGFREMFEGVDPLKIPILYDHTKPARFIPFGRTPQDLNIIEQFKRFAELVTAAFGLSVGDLRIFEHDRVLAGVQASQQVTARSGIGFYVQVVEDFINSKILFTRRSGFKFKFVLGMTGEELQKAQVAQMRAQTLSILTGNQPILKPVDAQTQAVEWQIIDIKPTGIPAAPGLEGLGGMLPEDSLSSMDQDAEAVEGLSSDESAPDAMQEIESAADEMNQYAAKSMLQDSHLIDKSRSKTVDQFISLWKEAFKQVAKQVKEGDVQKVIDLVMPYIEGEEKADIEKAVKLAAQKLEDFLADEDWYKLPDIVSEVADILKSAYEEGVLTSRETIWQQGYSAGFASDYALPPDQQDFMLRNTRVIELITDHGAELVQHVDDGTKFYLRQIILQGIDNGSSSASIAKDIQNNLFGLSPTEARKLSETRTLSIVNTELNWADSRANFDQMVSAGLRTKQWVTRGYDVCPICLGNEALGAVPLDHEYETVFKMGGMVQTTLHPPAHPMTCHCNLEANPDELKIFFDEGSKFWQGDELDDRLREQLDNETKRMISEAQKQRKSLPSQLWGQPDQIGKRSRFETVSDAQHWLSQFSLVPVISDSNIDVKGANYTYAGVVWGKDGDPWVEAALVEADQLPLDDIEQGRASIFGAKGIKKTGYANEVMIYFEVPQDIAQKLQARDSNPHVTIGIINNIDGVDFKTIHDAIENVAARHDSFTLLSTGDVKQFSETIVAIVKVSPKILAIRNELKDEFQRAGCVLDATWSEYRPHVSIVPGSIDNTFVEEYAVSWPVFGLWLNFGDQPPEFFAFGAATKHLPGKHDQKTHGSGGDAISVIRSPIDWQLHLPMMRRRHEYSQSYIAKMSGVSAAAISAFETGKRMPTDAEALKVLSIFGNAVVKRYQDYIDARGPLTKSVLFEDYAQLIPGHYHKEFADFVRNRSNQEPSKVEDPLLLDTLYHDFMETLLVSGFDYWKGSPGNEYPPLVRSVTKSMSGYKTDRKTLAMLKPYLRNKRPSAAGAAKWLRQKGYVVVPTGFKEKHLPGKHDQQSHGGGALIARMGRFVIQQESDVEHVLRDAKNLVQNTAKSKAILDDLIAGINTLGRRYRSGEYDKKTLEKDLNDLLRSEALVKSKSGRAEEKAFYSGAGYSGVHDPDYDIPEDTSFFSREGFEKLKRYKKLAIDGNTVRAVERADVGGDPITKLYDALIFNTQEALQNWLQKVNAKPAGGKLYDILDVIAEDNTWPRK